MADVVFNILDIYAEDFSDGNESKYVIKLFGRAADGTTVSVNALDFSPFFYVRSPRVLSSYQVAQFAKNVEGLNNRNKGFIEAKQLMKKDFWGFRNEKKFPFIQLRFKNQYMMRTTANYFASNDVCWPAVFGGSGNIRLQVYESNIEPFLRMFHRRNVDPCGWVRIPAGKYDANTTMIMTTCKVDINTGWNNLMRVESPVIAPFRIASFDIECVSFDGQFPVPIRDLRKVVTNFLDEHATAIPGDIGSRFVSYFREMFNTGKMVCKGAPVSEKDMLSKLGSHRDSVVEILRGKMGYDANGSYVAMNRKFEEDDVAIVDDLVRMFSKFMPPLEGDPIIQIGVTMHVYGEKEASSRYVFVVGSCDPIDGAKVLSFQTEQEMLVAWTKFIRNELDPDIMLGYNIYGFDFQYINDRAEELDCVNQVRMLGRTRGRLSPFKTKMLSSSALGDNLLKYFDIDGRVVIDIMKVVQRDHKLDSYKLDNVAMHFTGDCKNDVSPNDIFRLQKGTSADRRVIAEYCIQDCALLNKLCSKLELVANNMGMANVCCVPLNYIFMRGQGIKIFSLVSKQCKEDDYIMPVVKMDYNKKKDRTSEDEEGYEGAIVLDPKPGIYMENPITVLDYASLYPSSMISENISHDTIVLNSAYDNLPGVEYVDVVYDEFQGSGDKKVKTGEKRCRYAQSYKGVLPRILQHLLAQRKSTRMRMDMRTVTTEDGDDLTGWIVDEGKRMKLSGTGEVVEIDRARVIKETDTYDEFQKAVLDGLQLAYKVTANSLYGQVGARTSPIYMKELAASTTATGRNMIIKAKKFIEEELDGTVIYGDSVTGCTITLLRINGTDTTFETFETIATLFGVGWVRCEEEGRQTKEACELVGVEVWTDEGWTEVHRIIRHELAMHKTIMRVSTKTSVVCVTDDHSLLRPDGSKVSPKDIVVGDMLLHATNLWSPGATAHPVCKIETVPYRGYVYDLTTSNHKFQAGFGSLVVSNTDSIFIQVANKEKRTAMEKVKYAMEYGIAAQEAFKPHLKPPHDCEWEKVFYPFIIFSKKRYIGNVYDDVKRPDKFKMKCMGVVLKRRDNAHIVKTVYGGVIDILLNQHNIPDAVRFLEDNLRQLVEGKFPIEELVITKSLRASYKDPAKIAHKVLAERIGERDPGNKPQVNDRIPYVYVKTEAVKGTKMLQGERIETPDYIVKNKLVPDYKFYISNQLMKPIQQIFGLVVEQLGGYNRKPDYWEKLRVALATVGTGGRPPLEGEKLDGKVIALREEEAQKLLFEPALVALGEKAKRRLERVEEYKPVKPKKSSARKSAPKKDASA